MRFSCIESLPDSYPPHLIGLRPHPILITHIYDVRSPFISDTISKHYGDHISRWFIMGNKVPPHITTKL
jgi:hypothetical protein